MSIPSRLHRDGKHLSHHVRHAPSLSWVPGESTSCQKLEFLKQFHIRSNNDLLDAHGARGKQPLQAPVRTPAGEKRMLSNYQGELPLAYSPNGGQLLAAVDSTQLSETGTRRYLPTVGRAAGPVFGRRSVGRVAHYKTDLWGTSTYQKANQDLSYSRNRAWTDEESRRLKEAVEQFGAEHAWQRIAIEVGDNRAAGDCRRHWEDAGRSKSRCVGTLQRSLEFTAAYLYSWDDSGLSV